jgi:hypothetical protein
MGSSSYLRSLYNQLAELPHPGWAEAGQRLDKRSLVMVIRPDVR